jgi:hypothetical protein
MKHLGCIFRQTTHATINYVDNSGGGGGQVLEGVTVAFYAGMQAPFLRMGLPISSFFSLHLVNGMYVDFIRWL